MRSFNMNKIKIVVLSLLLALFSSAYAEGTKVLYVLTSSDSTYQHGELTLHNIAAVLRFSERKNDASSFMDLAQFTQTLRAYIAAQKETKQTAALSLYNDTGANNIVVQFADPIENNGSLSMKAQVLQGTLPANMGMSTLFIVLLEPEGSEKG